MIGGQPVSADGQPVSAGGQPVQPVPEPESEIHQEELMSSSLSPQSSATTITPITINVVGDSELTLHGCNEDDIARIKETLNSGSSVDTFNMPDGWKLTSDNWVSTRVPILTDLDESDKGCWCG
jgi:hypothetical protein